MNKVNVIEVRTAPAGGKTSTLLVLAESFCKTENCLYLSDELSADALAKKIKHLGVTLNDKFMYLPVYPDNITPLPEDLGKYSVFFLDLVDEHTRETFFNKIKEARNNAAVFVTKQLPRNSY